jgi:hypothetical protein
MAENHTQNSAWRIGIENRPSNPPDSLGRVTNWRDFAVLNFMGGSPHSFFRVHKLRLMQLMIVKIDSYGHKRISR